MRHTRTVIRLAAWSALAASVLGVLPAAEAQANKRWMKINFYHKKATDAYQAKNWAEAIEYYERYLEFRPFDCGNRYNLACSYSLNKQTKEALDALEESIEHGWDDSPWMQQDSDLDYIEGESRFAELLKLADECRDEQFVLHTPRKLRKGKGAPLIVALHNLGGNPREFIASWKEAADEMRVVVVAPRGPVRMAQQARMPAGWYAERNPNNLDMPGAKSAIDAAIAAAGEACKIDEQRIILAGFDQGGAVALKLVGEHPESFAGVVTIAARYISESDTPRSGAAKEELPRICLIVGTADQGHTANLRARDMFEGAGYEVRCVELPAIAHELPGDYVQLETEAVKFILGK